MDDRGPMAEGCFRYGKDTNLKAIHNAASGGPATGNVVSDMAKILI